MYARGEIHSNQIACLVRRISRPKLFGYLSACSQVLLDFLVRMVT